jgi:hypothetical protein
VVLTHRVDRVRGMVTLTSSSIRIYPRHDNPVCKPGCSAPYLHDTRTYVQALMFVVCWRTSRYHLLVCKAIQSNPQSDGILFVELVREGCRAITVHGVKISKWPVVRGDYSIKQGDRQRINESSRRCREKLDRKFRYGSQSLCTLPDIC